MCHNGHKYHISFFAAVASLVLFFQPLVHAAQFVMLEWDPNPESDIAGYRVYYGTNSGLYIKTLDVGNTTTASISNLSSTNIHYFVVTAYNIAGLESLPSDEVSVFLSNQAPVAADDTVTMDEGSSATINVLSNDNDPDDGPASLSIQSADSTNHGTTSVIGNNVIYSPNSGFYGTDTFSYAITDGALNASATVTVNVQSTAKANNLTDAGLIASDIGSAIGGSRVLADNTWELTGAGIGVAAIADSVYFENTPQTGNFQALLRIQSLASSGAAPEVGLMLRESTAADARFAMLAATPDGYSIASRTIAGGTSSKTTLTAPTQFPDVWLLIERNSDSITFATSTDGVTFDSAGSTVLASLANEVNLGLFVSSGTAVVDARAIVSDYTVIEATSASGASGLTAQYFDDMNLTNLRLTRQDPTVDFSWGRSSPDPALPSDYFSVRWTGKVQPRYSETYTFHTKSDDGVRLWVNGKLLIDNWTNHAPTENTGTVSLTAGQKYDIVMEYYEHIYGAVAQLLWSSPRQPKEIIPGSALSPDDSAATPNETNQAPVAADDTVTMDEGSSATINVLSNDNDPDDGPASLSIQSADSTNHGTTSVIGNNVIYSPNSGFYGTDTFSYAITDGALNASATVTVNVQSTAKANNLTDAGLIASDIGSAIGGSRVLADNTWELTGAGIGVAAIADSVYFENTPQTGNFQALLRIQSLASSGAAPEVGLMLRESTAADARFAMLAATPDGYSIASRTIAGGTSSKTTLTAPTQFPDVWLLIERNSDSITFATSTDGVTFDSAGSTVLASLANEVNLGLFVSSGTAVVDARAIVSDYTVIEATSASGASGLTAQYFDDMNLTNLRLTRQDPTVDFSWGRSSPDPALPSDYFSVRWTGKVQPRYSETYTFHTKSDDGVRLWVNGKLLIDNWTNHAPTENTGTISLTAGQKYNIVMEYYEYRYGAVAQLLWSSTRQSKEIIPESALTSDGSGSTASGLTAEYYADMSLTNLKFTRHDPTVDFSWGQSSPDPLLPSDYFSVRWTGKVEPRYSETYTFHTKSDDGVRLWVNGKLLIDNWTNHAPTENTGTISLTAGQKYNIVMEYYEYRYGAVAQLLWSSTRQSKEIIPESALTSDGSAESKQAGS